MIDLEINSVMFCFSAFGQSSFVCFFHFFLVSCLEPSDLLFWNQHEVLIWNSNSFSIQHFFKPLVDWRDGRWWMLPTFYHQFIQKSIESLSVQRDMNPARVMKQHGTNPPGVHPSWPFYILCPATKRKRLSEKSTPHSSWINVAMGFNNSVLAVNTAIFSWAPQFSSSLVFSFRAAHKPSKSKPFSNSKSSLSKSSSKNLWKCHQIWGSHHALFDQAVFQVAIGSYHWWQNS